MKIRLDYVSNSSSSSFMLVGKAFFDSEIEEIAKALGCDYNDVYDMAEFVANKTNLNLERGISDYYDMWCLGLGFDAMKDDETKHDFVDKISKVLSDVCKKDIKAHCIIDGGYEG